jgi:glutathione transport system permease protein
MLNFLVKRLFGLLPTLALVAVLVFLFVHLLPGDPRGWRPAPKPTTRRSRWCAPTSGSTGRCRQFANFFVKIAHGDFGTSTRSKRPVSTEIGERFMPTLC